VENLENRKFRRKAVLAVSITLIMTLASIYVAKPVSATSVYTDSPVAGWASTRVNDTRILDNSTSAPNSVVFSGQKISNFEQMVAREASLGYNTIRASFAPYCGLHYGIKPPDSNFMGDYNSNQLARAIKIATYFNFWIVVDYHGYSDLYNSTTATCWQNVWFGSSAPGWISGSTGIVGQFGNNYTRIIWEPLNEPDGLTFPVNRTSWCGAHFTQCDANKTAYLSSEYQSWINADRNAGDTHSIVIQNLCSFTCQGCSTGNGDCPTAVSDYPTVTDSLKKIFISLHSYMSNLNDLDASQGGSNPNFYCLPNCYTNSTAGMDAQLYYNTTIVGVSQTGWPALNTEGGAFLSTCCVLPHMPPQDMILNGTTSYANMSFYFIQTVTSLYEKNTAQRIPFLWWGAASWTTYGCQPGYPHQSCTGTYGVLSPSECNGVLQRSQRLVRQHQN